MILPQKSETQSEITRQNKLLYYKIYRTYFLYLQPYFSISAVQVPPQGRKHQNHDIGYKNEINSNYQNYKTELGSIYSTYTNSANYISTA